MRVKTIISFLWLPVLSAALLVPVVQGNQEQLDLLSEEVAALEAKLAELSGSSGGGPGIVANIATAEKEIAETMQQLSEREQRIFEKEYLLAVYQSAFRVVTDLERGESLGTLTMPGGEVLQKVVFVDASNGTVNLQTSVGFKKLKFDEIPAAISGKFKLPPEIPSPATSLEALYAIKPGASDGAMAGDSGTDNSVTAVPPSDKVEKKAATSEVSEYLEIKERNDARFEKLDDLRARHLALRIDLKDLKAKRRNAQSNFDSDTIKKSKSIQDKVLVPMDNGIKAIDAEIKGIKLEMVRIRSEIE
ncbi:MAG: hypothetical protein P1U86_03060 [Verrucomicrobiales bacterium]|nr:hypothetical protein [Verrucomicrobiales bacterium]